MVHSLAFLEDEPKDDCAVWVGLLSTVEANWVRGEAWEIIPLHSWAAALIPRAYGLLIYNVDPI